MWQIGTPARVGDQAVLVATREYASSRKCRFLCRTEVFDLTTGQRIFVRHNGKTCAYWKSAGYTTEVARRTHSKMVQLVERMTTIRDISRKAESHQQDEQLVLAA